MRSMPSYGMKLLINVPAFILQVPLAWNLSRPSSAGITLFEDLVCVSSQRSNPVEFEGISGTGDHGELTIRDFSSDDS